jgi:hypothetical protein
VKVNSENNRNSFFLLSNQPPNGDPTFNRSLQLILNEKDYELWDQMDEVTVDAFRTMAGNKTYEVEWWHQPKPRDKLDIWKSEILGNDTVRTFMKHRCWHSVMAMHVTSTL